MLLPDSMNFSFV